MITIAIVSVEELDSVEWEEKTSLHAFCFRIMKPSFTWVYVKEWDLTKLQSYLIEIPLEKTKQDVNVFIWVEQLVKDWPSAPHQGEEGGGLGGKYPNMLLVLGCSISVLFEPSYSTQTNTNRKSTLSRGTSKKHDCNFVRPQFST